MEETTNTFAEAIFMGLLKKYRSGVDYPPQNRRERRARGERGHTYGFGSMSVPKTRKVKR